MHWEKQIEHLNNVPVLETIAQYITKQLQHHVHHCRHPTDSWMFNVVKISHVLSMIHLIEGFIQRVYITNTRIYLIAIKTSEHAVQ